MKHLFICLSVLCVFMSTKTNAQTDSTQIADVIITENRLESTVNKSSRSVTVLTKKELEALSGRSPNNWLGTVSGVDIRQRGPEGVQADIGIRGGSFDQTLVMLNGMKLSDPQTGHHMMNLPLTNEAIEQIDVIKTSASRIYGINALSGSVNFITRVPTKNMIYGGVYAGDFGLYGFNAGAAFNTKSVGQHIAVGHSSSDGYKDNTDFTINQLFYQATVKAGKGKLNLMGGYTTRDFGAAGFYVPNSTEYEKTKTAFGGVQYEIKYNHLKVKAQLYYRYNEDDYVFMRAHPEYYENHHYSHTAGAEVHATYSSKFGETGFGIDSRTERLNSNNLGEHQRDIYGAFVEHRFNLYQNKISITPGVYVNAYTGNNTAWCPGIDLAYHFKPSWILFASVDQGMRLPTFTDLYYKGPSNIGNPNLKAEEATNYEAGIKFMRTSWFVSGAGFMRESNNLIDWARPNTSAKWEPLNVNHVTFRGIETQINKSFERFAKQLSISYTFIDAQFEQPNDYQSRYALSNIRHQVVGNIALNWFKNLNQTVTVRHIDREEMPDYTLVDSKIWYAFKHFSPYVDVSNIFDISYQEAGYVQMPGRWFKVGVDIKLFN